MKNAKDLLNEILESSFSENDKILSMCTIDGVTAYLVQCELFGIYWGVVTSNGINQVFDDLEDANIFYKGIKAHLVGMK